MLISRLVFVLGCFVLHNWQNAGGVSSFTTEGRGELSTSNRMSNVSLFVGEWHCNGEK